MALFRSNLFAAFLLVLFVFAHAPSLASGFDLTKEKMTHLHLYFHGFFAGASNPTTYTVVSLHNNSSSSFGDILVYDSILTEGKNLSSEIIGRAQGMDAAVSLTDEVLLTSANFVFTAGQYNGSSLALFGSAVPSVGAADRPVVGGSGVFRMARGYALSKILQYIPNQYLLMEYDFYVWHY